MCETECGGNLTADAGSLASPNWPYNYAHHQNCVWNISVSRHKVLLLLIVVVIIVVVVAVDTSYVPLTRVLLARCSNYLQEAFSITTFLVLHFPVSYFPPLHFDCASFSFLPFSVAPCTSLFWTNALNLLFRFF